MGEAATWLIIVGGLSALVSGLYFGDRGWQRGFAEGWSSGEAHGLTKRIGGSSPSYIDTRTNTLNPDDWWRHGLPNPYGGD